MERESCRARVLRGKNPAKGRDPIARESGGRGALQNGNLSWQERHETKAPSWPLVIRAPAQRTNAKARRANRRAFGESGRSINSRVACGAGRSINSRVGFGTGRSIDPCTGCSSTGSNADPCVGFAKERNTAPLHRVQRRAQRRT